jgi:hypothetical protein
LRPRLLLPVLLLAALCAPAHAAREFARVERVDIEPYVDDLARVRVFLTLAHLQGSLIDKVDPKDLVLAVGNQKIDGLPWVAPWDAIDDELQIVLVVEVGTPYAGALEPLSAAGMAFLKELPKGTRVAVIPYGVKIGRAAKLTDLAGGQRQWKKLHAEEEEGELDLVDAVDRAVKLVAGTAPQTPRNGVRRLVVVISDGVDGHAANEKDEAAQTAIRKKVKKVVKAANDGGVTIHTIGFSFFDERAPLKNLAELSKKTAGTFRWAKTQEAIGPHLDNLKLEIRKQLVLTWYVPIDSLPAGKSVQVQCKSSACGEELPLQSNARPSPEARCGGEMCSGACMLGECMPLKAGGGWSWWVWLLGGVGILAVIGIGVAVKGRGQTVPRPMPGARPSVGMPAQFPGAPATGQYPAGQFPGGQFPGQRPMASPHPVAPQAARPQLPAAGSPQPAAGGAGWFLIMSGPRQGQHVPLRHGFSIGKAPGNDLLIDDGFTSSRHAQVVVDHSGFNLVDVGSTNGTFVNGVRSMQAHLIHGTSVRIGQTELRFLKG